MLRDLTRVRRAASLVADDLNRTLGEGWRCEVSDDYVLTVEGPSGVDFSALAAEVEDEDWYVRPEVTPEEQSEGLDADAEEAVAGEVIEVLRVLGVSWPVCPEHGPQVSVCEGTWFCSGEPEHDLNPVGSLGSV